MTEIIPLPGTHCRYWCIDRCLYKIRLNPGLERDVCCQVLERLEHCFDDHVLRCECFGLSAEKSGLIWKQRMRQVLEGVWDCPDYQVTGDLDQDHVCAHLFEDICLLRLPRCSGRCRYFELWTK